MKKTLSALLSAGSLLPAASAAQATTFPTLTTIYVGSGLTDTGSGANVGIATTIHCTNTSGLTTSLRFVVLSAGGNVAASPTFNGLPHGFTITVSTHHANAFSEFSQLSPGSIITHGGIVIESTQSGVFCTAMIVDAAATVPSGIPLHLVRVNPHPGTVE